MKKYIIIFASVAVVLFILVWVIIRINQDAHGKELYLQKRISVIEEKYKQDSVKLVRTIYMRDSISVISNYLSKYWALADALYERDSVRTHLQYGVGDRVMLKRDSGRAVVTDIIIGGSKYEYYVKYRVQLKDKSFEEILPELLY